MSTRPWLPLAAFAIPAWLAISATAQPVQGDVVMTTANGIFSTGPTSGGRTTIFAASVFHTALMANGNRDIVSATTATVFRLRGGAVQSTLATVIGGTGQVAIDQDGSYCIAAPSSGLLRVSSGALTTVASLSGVFGVCRSDNTGDFFATGVNGELWRYSPVTGSTSTLTTLTGDALTEVAYLPDVNRLAVARGNRAGVLILRMNGNVVRTIASSLTATALTYDEVNRSIYVGTASGDINRYNVQGTLFEARNFGDSIRALEIFGDRNLSLSTTGQAGTSCTINCRWSGSPNRQVCLAMSTGLRPGITLSGSGRHLPLMPDWLFFVSFCGGLPVLHAGIRWNDQRLRLLVRIDHAPVRAGRHDALRRWQRGESERAGGHRPRYGRRDPSALIAPCGGTSAAAPL